MTRLRRVAVAALVAIALALSLGALAVPASAASAPTAIAPLATPPSGNVVGTSNGWCTTQLWGGTFYCGSQTHTVQGEYYQVFVIGTNNEVYTNYTYNNGATHSGWAVLNDPGNCAGSITTDQGLNSEYYDIFCTNKGNGNVYYMSFDYSVELTSWILY